MNLTVLDPSVKPQPSLRISSVPGEGSAFIVSLPLQTTSIPEPVLQN